MTANKSLWHRRKRAENELTWREGCAPFTAFFLAAKDYFRNGLIPAVGKGVGEWVRQPTTRTANPFATFGRLLELEILIRKSLANPPLGLVHLAVE